MITKLKDIRFKGHAYRLMVCSLGAYILCSYLYILGEPRIAFVQILPSHVKIYYDYVTRFNMKTNKAYYVWNEQSKK